MGSVIRYYEEQLVKFQEYVWEFYGPESLYGHFFHGNLTMNEIRLATALLLECKNRIFSFDSYDREVVRDIILSLRGVPEIEHQRAVHDVLSGFFKKIEKYRGHKKELA